MMINDVPMDRVTLQFNVEDWISSDSALVTVSINATAQGNEGASLRVEMTKSLNDLVDVDWRFVGVERKVSKSGMEEWTIMAQARVEEKGLNNINERAKKLGRSGLRYRIHNVDFSPTKEQFEDVYATLREKIYKLIDAEVKALNEHRTGAKDPKWRVSDVSFASMDANQRIVTANLGVNNMVLAAGNYTPEESDADWPEGEGFNGFEVSQMVSLTANVVFSSCVSGFEEFK